MFIAIPGCYKISHSCASLIYCNVDLKSLECERGTALTKTDRMTPAISRPRLPSETEPRVWPPLSPHVTTLQTRSKFR